MQRSTVFPRRVMIDAGSYDPQRRGKKPPVRFQICSAAVHPRRDKLSRRDSYFADAPPA